MRVRCLVVGAVTNATVACELDDLLDNLDNIVNRIDKWKDENGED